MKIKYAIKSVPSDDTQALEDLLNKMSNEGWDLYTMQEIETEDGFVFNCIFTSELKLNNQDKEEDILNIKAFRSQMEKILYSSQSPYLSCKEIQEKIKQERQKIKDIKLKLEEQSEFPVSKNRQKLNDEMSVSIKKLDDLRQLLIKTISPSPLYSKIKQDKLTISLGEEILDIVNPDLGAELIAETVKTRERITEKLGYVIPKIVFEDDYDLDPYEFSIKIRGLEVVKSAICPNCAAFFENDLGTKKKRKNVTVDEITGKEVIWIESSKTKDFWEKGLSCAEYISRLLEYVVIQHIDELFDYNDVNKYIEIVSEQNSFLCDNIIPDFVSISDLKYILTNLLKEEVSIKDIVYIFEKINDYAEDSLKEDLIDKIRFSLSPYICKNLAGDDYVINVFDLSEKTNKLLFSDLEDETCVIKIEEKIVNKLKKNILKKAAEYDIAQNEIIILAPSEIRRMLFLVLSQILPMPKVISKDEISSGYVINVLDEI